MNQRKGRITAQIANKIWIYLSILVLLLIELGKLCYKQLQFDSLMRIFGPESSLKGSRGFTLVRHQPGSHFHILSFSDLINFLYKLGKIVIYIPGFISTYLSSLTGFLYQPVSKKANSLRTHTAVLIVSLIVLSCTITAWFTDRAVPPAAVSEEIQQLFMLDQAGLHIEDLHLFEEKVRIVSGALDIAPEWLMAVMHSESRFNPAAVNHRGSGATGLIQFMVPTVRELNDRMGTEYYMNDIRLMAAHDQMQLVYEYLQQVRERYGEFRSLTDLYLAILYPRAINKEQTYVLYAQPSRMYRMNSGLDENKDGQVTVSDIEKRMQRLYPDAFKARKPSEYF
ncbi:MAG: lytic transglycosylase domain-containing protein [Bacteroidetes bacterium]|nr:MAG: lytic transglycosylase domain-containing protein [Bacteroidota bacterium]